MDFQIRVPTMVSAKNVFHLYHGRFQNNAVLLQGVQDFQYSEFISDLVKYENKHFRCPGDFFPIINFFDIDAEEIKAMPKLATTFYTPQAIFYNLDLMLGTPEHIHALNAIEAIRDLWRDNSIKKKLLIARPCANMNHEIFLGWCDFYFVSDRNLIKREGPSYDGQPTEKTELEELLK